MSGISKNGFTLLEILVVILLIGIMATLVVPNIMPRRARFERDLFLNNLSSLIQLGWQRAVQYQKSHRILFDLEHKMISIQEPTGALDEHKKPLYGPIKTMLKNATLALPPMIEVQQLYINGSNELRADRDVFKVWFYCMPNGMVQSVIINMLDTTSSTEEKISMVINPFNAQSTIYESFQKP